MKILALDISTVSSGWFVTKASCGMIVPPKGTSLNLKLAYFRAELENLMLKYKPDLTIIEDAYYRPGFGNIHTLKQLCFFAGVAVEVAGTHGIKVEFMTATQARKFCCGNHDKAFKKPEVFKYFVEKYELNDWTFDKHNDITDAMALGRGYREIQRTKEKGNKKKTRK